MAPRPTGSQAGDFSSAEPWLHQLWETLAEFCPSACYAVMLYRVKQHQPPAQVQQKIQDQGSSLAQQVHVL